MGRTGEEETLKFKTKKEAEKWIANRKKENDSDLKTPSKSYDYQDVDGYYTFDVKEFPKISGKPQSECIEELKKKAETQCNRYGDSAAVVYYAEIDPKELNSAVIDDLQAQAQKVGDALAKAKKNAKLNIVKRGKKDEKQEFVKCSNCESLFARKFMRGNNGFCPICKDTNWEKHKDISGDPLRKILYDSQYQKTEMFGKPMTERYNSQIEDVKNDPNLGGIDSFERLASQPLYVANFETAMEQAREETRKWIAREKELRRDPSLAKGKPKRKKSPKIPIAKAKSAYNFFMAAQKQKNPDLKGLGPLQKMCSELWKKLDEDQKKPYTTLSEKDKTRYQKELEQWKRENPAELKKIEDAKKSKKKSDDDSKKNWIVAFCAISAHH